MAENKPKFVADASILLKWATYETEDLEQSLMFEDDVKKERVNVLVPIHCFPEICNMLGRDRRNMAISFLSYLLNSDITECGLTFNTAVIAFDLMEKYNKISFYDAFYHALAIRENAVFITADQKYYNKTRRRGNIMLLKNYGKKR